MMRNDDECFRLLFSSSSPLLSLSLLLLQRPVRKCVKMLVVGTGLAGSDTLKMARPPERPHSERYSRPEQQHARSIMTFLEHYHPTIPPTTAPSRAHHHTTGHLGLCLGRGRRRAENQRRESSPAPGTRTHAWNDRERIRTTNQYSICTKDLGVSGV